MEQAGDRFDTVAVTWSQPEAAVMLAMFAFYGIPAFAVGRCHMTAVPTYGVALQGIAMRVHHSAVDEARELLAEVADRPAAIRPYPLHNALLYRGSVAFALFLITLCVVTGNYSLASVAALPATLFFTCAPPTRTPSTFLLETKPTG